MAKIAASIVEYGWTNPILVDGENGIIAGHGRLAAARKLDLAEVPVIELAHLSPTQKRAYVISDNRLALDAGWDDAMLALELAELSEAGYDLALTGFDDAEIEQLLATDVAVDGEADDEQENDEPDAADDVPATSATPASRPGDVWQLGPHRVICGDAADPAVIEALMAGEQATLCFTSPPYGNQRDYTNTIIDWDALMRGVFAQLPMAPTGQVLVNLGLIHREQEVIPYWDAWLDWMRTQGWRRFAWYVWDQGPGLPGDWNGRLAPAFEFVFHFNRKDSEARRPNKIVPCIYAGRDTHAAYQDRLRQIDEKQAQARAALAAGNYEQARKLAEEAIALAERTASAVTKQVEQNGKTVTQTMVSEGQAAATAIGEIKEAAGIADAALKGLGDAHKQAASAAGAGADEAKRALASVSDELDKLRQALLAQDKLKLDIDIEAAKAGIEKLKALTEAQQLVAKIQADTKEAQASLEKLKSDTDNLQLLAKVEADTTQVMANIDRLKGTLASANVEIPALVSFDQPRQQLASFALDAKTVLSAPTSATHTVQPDLGQYRAAVSELLRPTSSTHTIYVTKVYTNAQGGLIQKLAEGGQAVAEGFRRMSGRIFGPGTETSDSVPALLSHGEFVIRAASVRKFGEAFFASLNAGFLPSLPRFAVGGAVGDAVSQVAMMAGNNGTTARDVVDLRFHVGGKPHTVQSSRETAMQLAQALRELSRGA